MFFELSRKCPSDMYKFIYRILLLLFYSTLMQLCEENFGAINSQAIGNVLDVVGR